MSSVLCIVSITYLQSQFVLSHTTVLYKEVAEDYYPFAICDREDKIHIAWQSDRRGNWDIYYTTLEDMNKRDFTSLTTSPEDERFPSIAEDEEGNIWVIWVESGTDGNSIKGKILGNQEWKETEIVSNDDCEMKSPSLVDMDSARMLVAWISKKEKTQEIRYIIHNASEKETKLLSPVNNPKRVVLGKTRKGEIFALWDSMSNGKSNLYFSIFDREKGIFVENKPLISTEGEPFFGDTPSIAITSEGPSMLFFRNENWDILCSVESMGNVLEFPCFSQPVAFSETGALEDCPTAFGTSEGEIYLFWASNYTGDNEIFFCSSPDVNDFLIEGIQYEKGSQSVNEQMKQFVRNVTKDPNHNDSSPYGFFCDDIRFSAAVIGEKLWVVWDSYSWDITEPNTRRMIKCMKMSDEEGIDWGKPTIVVDSRKSKIEYGRDDRHPAITGTRDCVWLFWHSDRYRTEKDDNFEICYIYSKDNGESWTWRVPDQDPFLLTGDIGRDMCPSVSSIGDRIFVVWNSDRRFDDFDIFLCEFDGENCLSTQCIARQDTPEFNPSVTAYRGWHLSSLGYAEDLMVAWESVEEGRVVCHFSTARTIMKIGYLHGKRHLPSRRQEIKR